MLSDEIYSPVYDIVDITYVLTYDRSQQDETRHVSVFRQHFTGFTTQRSAGACLKTREINYTLI